MMKTLWGVIERANLPWQIIGASWEELAWHMNPMLGLLSQSRETKSFPGNLRALCKEAMGRVFPVPFNQT